MPRKSKGKKISVPVIRGFECPHCGTHIHLVLLASDRYTSAELRTEIKNLADAKLGKILR